MEETSYKIERHIDALDGVRALAIMLVAWFHVWEQDWLTPYIELDNMELRKVISIPSSDLDLMQWKL